ncbi:cell division protein FtsQ/DivIB [Arachidicoccus sp.]|uniref:cell division protein FtsQ/DivIB n=1 Tax=Arachidicoccus sp. TaxID=1872624 RepID=UPI003D1BE5E1
MIKKRIILFFWILIGITAIGLLIAGAKNKGNKTCKGINIDIHGDSKNIYLDQQGLKIQINEYAGKIQRPIREINLRNIETQLKKDVWIKEAKLYFDNNQILQVGIEENNPVARIFTVNGNSFYIDSSMGRLPVNRNVLAKIPVFTGFPSNREKLSAPDSTLLAGVKNIANYISIDTFWTAFISQINITNSGDFQIIPTIGDEVIDLGNAENIADKLNRLYSFYHQVLKRTGINKYKEISVQYNGQVVASTELETTAPPNAPPKTVASGAATTITKTSANKKTIQKNTTKNKNK